MSLPYLVGKTISLSTRSPTNLHRTDWEIMHKHMWYNKQQHLFFVFIIRDKVRDEGKTEIGFWSISPLYYTNPQQWDLCFLWSVSPVLGHRSPNRLKGAPNGLLSGSLSFLDSMRMVYCRINKLSTDNSFETLTHGLCHGNSVPGHSTLMNINRYGITYRMEC